MWYVGWDKMNKHLKPYSWDRMNKHPKAYSTCHFCRHGLDRTTEILVGWLAQYKF